MEFREGAEALEWRDAVCVRECGHSLQNELRFFLICFMLLAFLLCLQVGKKVESTATCTAHFAQIGPPIDILEIISASNLVLISGNRKCLSADVLEFVRFRGRKEEWRLHVVKLLFVIALRLLLMINATAFSEISGCFRGVLLLAFCYVEVHDLIKTASRQLFVVAFFAATGD